MIRFFMTSRKQRVQNLILDLLQEGPPGRRRHLLGFLTKVDVPVCAGGPCCKTRPAISTRNSREDGTRRVHELRLDPDVLASLLELAANDQIELTIALKQPAHVAADPSPVSNASPPEEDQDQRPVRQPS